jgi:TolA-binding protein
MNLHKILGLGVLLFALGNLSAQTNPEQQAEMILTSARKALNEQNYPFAAQRFNEFLQKFGGHPQAGSARYGLGICLLEGDRNYEKAFDQFVNVANNAALPESPYAQYFAGLAQRNLALNDLAQAVAKPNEAQQFQQKAATRFNEAAQRFSLATKAFTEKLPKEGNQGPEFAWAGRARADLAEIELRQGKFKEAKATSEPFLKDKLWESNPYRKLGVFHHGVATFQLKEYIAAGRALELLAPYDDPYMGLHARFLMGRVLHETNNKNGAAEYYQATLAAFEKAKKDAIELLKQPDRFRNAPSEKIRLETLTRTPPPEYVAGSYFYSAVLSYEAGKYADAVLLWQAFVKDYANTPLAGEAFLRIGAAQVQLKNYPEAINTLNPLVDKQPKLADQTLLWLGKAHFGLALQADPMKPQDRETGLKKAAELLRSAADKSNQLIATDAEAKIRRGEALLELAEVQIQSKQIPDAAGTFEVILNEKLLPARQEETHQRWVTALHLSGNYQRSDEQARKFLELYPESPLRLTVLFRYAENAYQNALQIEKRDNRLSEEAKKAYDEAQKRYESITSKEAEFERQHLARYGLAMCHFKKGELEKAQEQLEKIPDGERNGELAYASYLHADCLLRRCPAEVKGATQVRELLGNLEIVCKQLESFISANPKAPEIPEAMLKLGTSQARLGAFIKEPQERAQMLQTARQTFDNLMKQFPKEPASTNAVLERAKVMALQGDRGGAINELRRFLQDPLNNTEAAPYAVVYLGTLLREQGRAEEGAKLLAEARQRHEPNLQKTPEVIALLRYQQGVCLQEWGKFPEARTALESVATVYNNKPLTVEAFLRAGQCRIQEVRKQVESAWQEVNKAQKPDQRNNALNNLRTVYAAMVDAANQLETRATQLAEAVPNSDARERMFYEAAWAFRFVAEWEWNEARDKVRSELQAKLQDEADKNHPNRKAPPVIVPEITKAMVPVTPSEKKMLEVYEKQVRAFNDTLLSVDARFEWSELLMDREKYDEAIKILKDANDLEPRGDKLPSAELLDRIRVRLGACYYAKKDYDSALAQLKPVAENEKSPHRGQALYRAAEALLAKNDAAGAVTYLVLIRDRGELQNMPAVSDRAMLRLGHAYAALEKWTESRQACEILLQRYGNSPWVHDARYAMGWASQKAGRFDEAIQFYQAVCNNTSNELAAKAHLQIGLCHLAQKRHGDAISNFLIVPTTFDFPELSATALTEAARASVEDKKIEQAEKLLKKVIKDYPTTPWAKVAQERLEKLPKEPANPPKQ